MEGGKSNPHPEKKNKIPQEKAWQVKRFMRECNQAVRVDPELMNQAFAGPCGDKEHRGEEDERWILKPLTKHKNGKGPGNKQQP